MPVVVVFCSFLNQIKFYLEFRFHDQLHRKAIKDENGIVVEFSIFFYMKFLLGWFEKKFIQTQGSSTFLRFLPTYLRRIPRVQNLEKSNHPYNYRLSGFH